MSDAIEHIDLDDEQFEDAPRALREYAAKLKKALDETTKRADGLQRQVASHALGDVLGDKGFKNPKRVEKDLLADGIDPLDKSAVEGWLEEYGDDYAKAEVSTEAPAPTPQANVEPEVQAGYGQLSGIQNQLHQPADMSKLDAAVAELPADATAEQVLAAFAKHGV